MIRNCAECGAEVAPLEMFPKDRCIDCHARWFDTQPPITARELARMWGGR